MASSPEAVRIESARHQTHPSPAVARAGRAALALWIGFVVLAVLRAWLAFVPNMWGWGFDLLRFVPPVRGWTLWALSAVTLIPLAARLALPIFTRLGRMFDRHTALAYGLPVAAAVALAWTHPDHVRFVGDFLLRFGTAEKALKPVALFTQALPLDVSLHYDLLRWLDTRFKIDINISSRLIGALECGALAALAITFGRALGQRGAYAIASAAIVFFGGYLGMFTGYGKAIAEVTLLTVAVASFGLRVIREGKGLVALSACVAMGLVFHRATLGLIPALVVCWIVAHRTSGRELWSRRSTWVAAALPVLALAVMLPRTVTTIAKMDPVHFTPPAVAQVGFLGAMFGGTRPVDLVNVIALLSPLALALPLGLLAHGRWGVHAREGALLSVIVLPWLGMLLVMHPSQGIFRDWDNLSAAGMALSLMTAWLVGLAARGAQGWAWLCVPAILGAAAPSVQWLMHNHDRARGLERVETWLREPPARTESERAKTLDYLGIRYAQLENWERAAEAMARAAALAPSPRVLLQWALAEQARGNDGVAQDAYRRLLAIAPREERGWYGLALVSWRLGDLKECRRAAQELLRLRPGDLQVLRILAQVDQAEADRAAGVGR